MACVSPYYSQLKGNWVPFPCGRCPPCKKRRVDSWVFRLLQEDKVSSSAHFVTLSYDPEHVPLSPNGFMTLDKSEFPRYMKRLRKLCPDSKLKYYACGEYGSKRRRPHYHAIVFNCPDESLFFEAWKLDGKHFGQVYIGDCSGDSVAYCMKYIDKRTDKMHSRDDRIPEFSLMSKGLGESYITPAIKRYHNANLDRNYLTVAGNHKIALPRYYRSRLFDDDALDAQRGIIEIEVAKANSDNYAEFLKMFGDNPNYDYGEFVQSQREAIVQRFYSNQKLRD